MIGRSVHLTPSGIDFDEHVFQLGQGTVVRAAGSLIFPRCCTPRHLSLMENSKRNHRDTPAARVDLTSYGPHAAIWAAMQGGPLSPLRNKMLLGDVGVQRLSGNCRQLPVEEGEKLVKFKAQRFGLKALW